MATPKSRIIIDTDPGVDDTLALLLAMASSPQELELLLISVTYGNVPRRACLKNVVTLFHVLEQELGWRRAQGRAEGYDVLRSGSGGSGEDEGVRRRRKPVVALGPEHALEDELLMEDAFHGPDGLHGVHAAHPHLTPEDTWESLFAPGTDEVTTSSSTSNENGSQPSFYTHFTPSKTPAHKEILRMLREEPVDSITICAVGPLTNLAMAAAEDPETFLRVKEILVMGGAINVPGNITPVAEFNTYADAVATARLLALTSAVPASTMPVVPQNKANLPHYPDNLSRQLRVVLFPLDITTPHLLGRSFFASSIQPHIDAGSPLAKWMGTIMKGVYDQIERMVGAEANEGLSLHDPLTIWYALSRDAPEWELAADGPEDIRVETSGQWTHGMHIVDRRGRKRAAMGQKIPGDEFGWLSAKRGNRVYRCVRSPGEDSFAPLLMERLFGAS